MMHALNLTHPVIRGRHAADVGRQSRPQSESRERQVCIETGIRTENGIWIVILIKIVIGGYKMKEFIFYPRRRKLTEPERIGDRIKVDFSVIFTRTYLLAEAMRRGQKVVCGRWLSSTCAHRPMEWKRDRCVTSQTLRLIVTLYRFLCALVCMLSSGGTCRRESTPRPQRATADDALRSPRDDLVLSPLPPPAGWFRLPDKLGTVFGGRKIICINSITVTAEDSRVDESPQLVYVAPSRPRRYRDSYNEARSHLARVDHIPPARRPRDHGRDPDARPQRALTRDRATHPVNPRPHATAASGYSSAQS
ncbi:hypothetical protein EVAR_8461_1 [Eumeta japonica]|uniref:Uncharacterized protein n=1 Tax=Eumeta variegata TaxID=151549 RepID=A0A4C1WEF6_EUMVA|nr:hypothetical protein EVAR_8461_1 [Eumeta japonica]